MRCMDKNQQTGTSDLHAADGFRFLCVFFLLPGNHVGHDCQVAEKHRKLDSSMSLSNIYFENTRHVSTTQYYISK